MEKRAEITPGFCPNCGSILPALKASGGINCYLCKSEFDDSGKIFKNLYLIKTANTSQC